jgi:hypothetical protein
MPDPLNLGQVLPLGACPVQSKTSEAASKIHRVQPAEPVEVPVDRDRPLEVVQELAPVALLPVEAQVAVPPAEVAAHQVAPDHPAEVADRQVQEGLARARQQAAPETVRKQVQQERRRSLAGRW